jgi:hypothetical protein
MERSSQSAAKLIRRLSELAERLAARDIVVASLHADYSLFGSWQLIAEKHHEAIRFFWDGRDSYITTESSPIRQNSAPNEWKHETAKGFDVPSGGDPLRFVEEYLERRFPV